LDEHNILDNHQNGFVYITIFEKLKEELIFTSDGHTEK